MVERWLEPLLERELAAVRAPEELWSRIQFPRAERSSRASGRNLAWAMAAVLVLAVLGLRASRQPLEIHSADGTEIQTWVKAHSGLELELPGKPARSIQLLGAHVLPGTRPAVELRYLAGNHEARLMVSRTDSTGGVNAGHGGGAAASWVMHGQRYTLACTSSEGLQAACLLCHG